MASLKLQPDPTFSAPVSIPVPGGEPVVVEFTFKHRGRKELAAFGKTLDGRGDADTILDVATGWDLSDPFNADSVALLVDNYFAAPGAIWTAYLAALTQAKEKN